MTALASLSARTTSAVARRSRSARPASWPSVIIARASSRGRGSRRPSHDALSRPDLRQQAVAEHVPNRGGIAAAQRAHVPAGLEAPRPEVVDALLARHAHGGPDVVGVLRLQPEALDPQLRAHAVLAGERDHAPRVLADHRVGLLAEG